MSPPNVPQAEAFFWGYELQIVTGIRYIGGFFRTEAEQKIWLGEKIEVWKDLVSTVA